MGEPQDSSLDVVDGPKRKYKNTFGGSEEISNNYLEGLDTINQLDEPWFVSGSYSSSQIQSSTGSPSSSSGLIWPTSPRFTDSSSSFGSRKGHGFSARAPPSSTRKIVFRTFQVLSLLLFAFGTYTLVITVISLSRSYPELDAYNTSTYDIHEELKTWIIHRDEGSGSPTSEMELSSLLDMNDFYFILNNVSICAAKLKSPSRQDLPSTIPSLEPTEPKLLGEGIYFMVIVHSAPEHFAERQAIRSTWGSVKSLKNWDIRLVFLLGLYSEADSLIEKSVFRESAIFGDIVSGSFHDTYRNLTYKHLMGYKWALSFCPGATFVLKTDDDAFIDIFQLFEFTSRTYGFHPEETLLCNVFPEGTSPVRTSNPESKVAGKKWIVTREEYPHENYPKYCGGLAYLITPDILQRILHVSRNSKFFWIDDVYVTGVLRELVEKEPFYLNLRYSYEPEEYRKWLSVRRTRKIPFMIVHVERGPKFSEEMNHLWRKTMRVWS